MSHKMMFIEAGNSLYRGFGREYPALIWRGDAGRWERCDLPTPQAWDWGQPLSDREAERVYPGCNAADPPDGAEFSAELSFDDLTRFRPELFDYYDGPTFRRSPEEEKALHEGVSAKVERLMASKPGGSSIAVGVIDVGSPKSGKLGWAILRADQPPIRGRDLDEFIERMAGAARNCPAAIGFEAPMFVPMRREALATLSARRGEGSRPWSAGAGATVTTTALAITTYTLAGLRDRLPEARASVDWGLPPKRSGDVLFFEAFVCQSAKGEDHAHDALIAAEATRAHLELEVPGPSAIDETDVFSMLGAALLRTGWSSDLALLATPCLVVKPGTLQQAQG